MQENTTNEPSLINTSGARRLAFLDLVHVTVLLALVALVLVVLRHHAVLKSSLFVPVVFVVSLAVLVLWGITTRSGSRECALSANDASLLRQRWLRVGATGMLLSGLVWISYYQPMKIHFWGGLDDAYGVVENSIWIEKHDAGANRPLLLLWAWVGHLLTPDRIEGCLWLAVALCFLNSALLMGILRTVMPGGGGLVPILAAVLFIASRGEPSRFFAMWTADFYGMTLFLTLLATWLFLQSYRMGNRWLLAASCIALITSLLTNDGIFPLTLLAPVLAWPIRRKGPSFWIWSYTWFGTVAVLAVRFIIFLTTSKFKYQATQTGDAIRQPGMLLKNIGLHLDRFFAYFSDIAALRIHWQAACLASILVITLGWMARRDAPQRISFRPSMAVAGLSVIAILLGIAPFLHLPYIFRTHFFAVPAEAALLAALLSLICSFVPNRAGWVLMVASVAALSGLSVAASMSSQQLARAKSSVYFEKTAHIYQQVHALSARYSRDQLILLIVEDPTMTPLGANYALKETGRALLGAPMMQMNHTDPYPAIGATFAKDGVDARLSLSGREFKLYGYDQIIAYRLSADGTVALLQQLPQALLPEQNRADEYKPLELLHAGPLTKLKFMQYPAWADKPVDVLDKCEGMILGRHWGMLSHDDHGVYRWAGKDAEIVVNSLGQSSREINLRVEPTPTLMGKPCSLQILDQQDRVVASATLSAQQELKLTVPTDPARVSVFRLRVGNQEASSTSDTGAASLRVFTPGEIPKKKIKGAKQAVVRMDIVGDDLFLIDRNWSQLKHSKGQTFRWVSNDAEFKAGVFAPPHSELVMDVESVSSASHEECRLQVLGAKGKILAETVVRGRQEIRVPLTITPGSDPVFRLHFVGRPPAGLNDSSDRNFRIFNIRLDEGR